MNICRNAWTLSSKCLVSIIAAALVAAVAGPTIARAAERLKAFPDALGWAATTPGGRGGQVLRVTTLAASGPGSLRTAVETKGPRIVVFEVGGVIDLERQSIDIGEPFLTIAGQTAPEPGITLIRGGIGISTHDVVIQHLRVRPGEAGAAKKSGWEVDGIATNGAWNVIVDHCSCTWATDENLSASGPRFDGDTLSDWQRGTSHGITFSNCIVAECLDNSTHGKGAHSKGSLIHDNATQVAIVGNLYASNVQRNPLFKGGACGIVVNNFIYNPGNRAIHYRLVTSEWKGHAFAGGQIAVVGNVMQSGPDTRSQLALLCHDGDAACEVFLKDNQALARDESPLPLLAVNARSQQTRCIKADEPPLWPPALEAMPSHEVMQSVLQNAGARPWARDK